MRFKVGNPILQKDAWPIESGVVKGKWKPPEIDYVNTQSLQGGERDSFILSYMGLVNLIASDIVSRLPPNIRLQDLIQVGFLGLLNAMGKYDPDKKILFSTFARIKITGAILDSLRKEGHYSRSKKTNLEEPLDQYFEDGVDGKDILDSGSKSPDELAHEKELKLIIKVALEEFLLDIESEESKIRFRDLYEQFYVKERSTKEIARDYNLSTRGVRINQLLIQMKNGIRKNLEAKGIRAKDINW